MTAADLQPGGWVLTRAKVVELHPNGVDLGLELFSKTDQYRAFVRRDLCEPTTKPIPDEPAAGSIATLDGVAYQRLSGAADGWFRPCSKRGTSWAKLNRSGDVEVVHWA